MKAAMNSNKSKDERIFSMASQFLGFPTPQYAAQDVYGGVGI